MGSRRDRLLMNMLLGTGVYLLDSLRGRLSENMEDLRGRARDSYGDLREQAKETYGTVSQRVSRASDVLRGEDHRLMSTTAAVLIGVGIGVGVGMLIAPGSGEETRSNLAEKMRDRFSREREKEAASGTYGA